MDAGCNLRYILSNAWEAEGRWWKSYNSGPSCLRHPPHYHHRHPQGTRGYNLTYTPPHPTQIYKLRLSSSLGNHLFLYL